MTTNEFWTGEYIKAENDFADKYPGTVEEVSYKRFGFEQGVRWQYQAQQETISMLQDRILLHEETKSKLLDDIEFQKKEIEALRKEVSALRTYKSSKDIYCDQLEKDYRRDTSYFKGIEVKLSASEAREKELKEKLSIAEKFINGDWDEFHYELAKIKGEK